MQQVLVDSHGARPIHWAAANPNPAAVGNKPPGPDNVCGYCQSPDHFIRDCPVKKAKDAKKKADELTTAI